MAILGLILAALISLVFFIIWMIYPTRKRRLINKLPGPPTLPLVGNAHLFKADGGDFFVQVLGFCETFREHGIFRGIIGPECFVALYRADTVEVLFNSSKHMSKSFVYKFLEPWLGTGLLISTGDKWKYRRRLLTPAFHFSILSDFLLVFNEQSDIMIQKLKKETVNKGEFDIFPYITLCALDIICDTAMGTNINAQANGDSEYVQSIREISEVIQQRQKQPWLWPDFIFNRFQIGKKHKHYLEVLHELSEKVIKERSKEYEEKLKKKPSTSENGTDDAFIGRKKRLAFLDMLLDANQKGAGLDFLDIREEVDTFMFEGHDTTAAAMNWAIHLIGANPDVQEKVCQEICDIFGDSDRAVTMDDLKEMKYLECVIKEALRLFPSVPMFARTISEDCMIGGYEIPKGTQAVVVSVALHMDPNHFPDPQKFDPDRWLPERSAKRHPYCYVPFSAGLRNCIGQKFAINEEKVMLSAIVRNFKIQSCQKREDLRPVGEIVMRPENGIRVKLTPRENASH